MFFRSTSFVNLFALANAWLPWQEKEIFARDGTTLFRRDLHKYDSQLRRYLPSASKIRGVNLGSLFVFEPWLAGGLWDDMCGDAQAESECTASLGQEKANITFQNHWSTWILKSDFTNMTSVGLNTVRIPVGFWMKESLVFANETFPQGGMPYLEQVCEWAAEAGLYVIIDLHGAPGAQVANNSFTGIIANQPGFYVDWQFSRALDFLSYLTTEIHSNDAYRTVGMIEIVNEPVRSSQALTMISSYYPEAFDVIRSVEEKLGVTSSNYLTVQMMNENWGSGNPNSALNSSQISNAAYDDHRYIKYDTSVAVTHAAYISSGCNDTSATGNSPTIVGEFSLSPPDDVQDTETWSTSNSSNIEFYQKWFAAQVIGYEKNGIGWVFWTWKTQNLNDYRWDYQLAVLAGVIPTNLSTVYDLGAC